MFETIIAQKFHCRKYFSQHCFCAHFTKKQESPLCRWLLFCFSIHIKQKSLDFSVETALLFLPLIIKRWCQPLGLHARNLTNRFVCNFLSSSAGFILCSCFFRLTLVFRLRFQPSLGRPFHDRSPLPFRFLTSAVFAPFRSLQFWILTTQPLLLPFPLFLPPPHSGFRSAPAPLSLPRSSPFSPAWFPVRSTPVPVLSIAVCFLSPFPDSLPQLFLRCLLPTLAFRIFRFPSASFRPLLLCFRLLGLPVFHSVLPASALQLAFPVLRFRSRFPSFPFLSGLISHAFLPVLSTRLSVGLLSSCPASLPQPFHR